MSMSAAAAYRTVGNGMMLNAQHSQFAAPAKASDPVFYHVRRVSDTSMVRSRSVSVMQDGQEVALVVMSFVSTKAWRGPSITHSAQQIGGLPPDSISINDIDYFRKLSQRSEAAFWQFQRLPPLQRPDDKPYTSIHRSICKLSPPIRPASGMMPHIAGLLEMSDFNISTIAGAAAGMCFSMPAIGVKDLPEELPEADFTRIITLNHTVHIHCSNFRADEMMYNEFDSPWAGNGRSINRSRFFSADGILLASCIQETLYLLKPGVKLPSKI